MILDFPDRNKTPKDVLTQDELYLLHLFRSLTPEQQEFYLEEGKVFIRHNNKNKSILPIKSDK